MSDDESSLAVRTMHQVVNLGVDGFGPFKSARDVAGECLQASGGDVDDAVRRSVRLHRRWATTSGGATGVGGFLVLPATLTAGMASAYVINARMIGTIAHLRGYDIDSEEVRTVVLAALFGAAGASAAQKVGTEVGEKVLKAQVAKVSGKTLVKINQQVGFRLVTKAGTRGVVNMTKLVPLIGAPIGATAENLTTRSVATYALKSFPPLPPARPSQAQPFC